MRSMSLEYSTPYFSKRTLQLYALALEEPLTLPSTDLSLDFAEATVTTDLKNADHQRILQRLSAGCRLFIASHEGRPVAYVFSSTGTCTVTEVEQTLHIMPGECYLYDAYTYPPFRGHGIYPALLVNTARVFRSCSYRHILIFTLGVNRASVQGIKKAGFSCYGTATYVEILGRKFWRYRTNNGHVKSYLGDSE